MLDYDGELNEEQRQVVMEAGGPLLVIAGAGSGKTRTLTFRVARLVETGVPPARIMLATFTNKAARSMLSRVQALIGLDISRLWGGTFHHLAHRVLRSHGHRLGYSSNFSILDQEDAKHLINACLTEAGIDRATDRFPKADLIGDIIGLASSTDGTIREILLGRYPYFAHRSGDIEQIAGLYGRRKASLNVMDFDDLLLNWRRLLIEHPEIQSFYGEQFEHVLVDEYQDTNALQAQIVDLMASHHRNLMVVGDDSQSIYSFRGANFQNIMHFPERYPDCKVFKLETNYRSTPEILNLANLSIINNERQFEKSLRAVRGEGVKPVLVEAADVVQQADFVAQRIVELARSGLAMGEIAILYRAHYHSMELQMELVRRGIPFEIRSGIRFFEQAHIKDVTSYLRILANPLDEPAWRRVLPLYPKVGRVMAEKVWKAVSRQDSPFIYLRGEAFLQNATRTNRSALARFQSVMTHLLDMAPPRVIPDMVDVILNEGYRDYLREAYAEATSREDDLYQLSKYSEQFDNLEDFLRDLALMTNLERDDVAPVRQEDRVVLSTIHQAKGLEWSTVLLIWCAEGMIPLERALKDPEGEEEERRLFYVAATRAKDQLYLCYPRMDYRRGMGRMAISPSRFIRELSPFTTRSQDRPYDLWSVDYD